MRALSIRRELLGLRAGDWRNFLLRDGFTTAASAPLTSPRSAEPTGTLTLVQTDGELSISSGRMLMPPQTTPTLGDQGFYSEALTRTRGRAIAFQVELAATTGISLGLALGTGSSLAVSQVLAGSGISFFGGGIGAFTTNISWSASVESFVALTVYDIVIVELDTGTLALIRGGAFTDWTLLWHNEQSNAAAGIYCYNNAATQNTWMDDVAQFDVGGLFASGNYDLAVFTDTSLASDDTWTAVADGEFEFDFALPGSPSAADRVTLEYRRQDANNKMLFCVERDAGNAAWDVDVKVVTAGVEAAPTGWTKITGVGAVNGLKVRTSGNTHRFYTRVGTTWAKRGTDITDAAYSALTGMGILAATGTTLTRTTAWHRTRAEYRTYLNVFLGT